MNGLEVMRASDLAGRGLLPFAGATAAAAVAGSLFTRRPVDDWYLRLRKPAYTPPAWVFAPVWSVLYGLIAWGGWRLWRAPGGRARRRALRLWALQLALNAAWTPIFFGARRPRLALADLVALGAAVAATVATARRVDRAAAWALTPYLGWTTFAGALNVGIVRRNPTA